MSFEPTRPSLPLDTEHTELYHRVREAIHALPGYFKTSTYIESAKYAAEYRNYHWQNLRQTVSNTTINQPIDICPYPKKSDQIADKPTSDNGGNFGRFARTGLMDEYLIQSKSIPISGISAQNWLDFFKIFQDQKPPDQIHLEILRLRNRLVTVNGEISPIEIILEQLEKLISNFSA